MARTFSLLATAHGWTDRHILSLTLRRIRQATAAVYLTQWENDLNARRLATAQLRTVCAYIAATMQLAEGQDNTMLTHAADLDLGPGTGNRRAAADPQVQPAGPASPGARINLAAMPDGPTAIRVGQPAPTTTGGLRELPLEAIGGLFGGGL